jgi:hypothetical protein
MTTGDVQLSWDPYYGFEYGTYYIYRSQTQSDFANIYSMSSSTTAYTETNPENNLYYYRVSVQRPSDCLLEGSGKKVDSGPYSHSMSNIEDNRLQGTGINSIYRTPGTIVVYPNPFSDKTTVRFHNPENKKYLVVVRDLSGKIVRGPESISGNEFELTRGNLASGYYFIEITGDEIFRGKIAIE